MRLPVEVLEAQLHAILEGILLWAHDSKNKFKLKVRARALPGTSPGLCLGRRSCNTPPVNAPGSGADCLGSTRLLRLWALRF
jgi:hypothetical protein